MSKTSHKRQYKTSFILDTRNYKDSLESLIERVTKAIESVGGSVKKMENIGQKEFSRVTDRHFPNGIYLRADVEAPANYPADLNEKLRLDKSIDRVLIESN